MRFSSRHQQGMTMLEILVAMLIGVFMMAGIIQTFASSKQTYRIQDNMGRLQENGRFATEYLSRQVRVSGFAGCLSRITPDTMENHVNDAGANGILGDFLASFRIPLEGFNGNSDGTWSPALSRVLMRDSSGNIVAYNPTPAPIAGTDILAVRTTEGRVQVEPPSMPTVAAALHVATDNGMQRGDIVLVSDCESSEVFQISNNNPSSSGTVDHATGNSVSPGNETKDFQKSYGTDAMIFRPSIKTYYIGMGNDGRNALWELNNHRSLNLDSTDAIEDNPRELIQGVEDMQITYGVDDDGDANADRFVDASAVDDSTTPADEWLQVVSVRFSLLLQTQEDFLAIEPQQYTYNSTTATAGDRRLRRIFTNTVGIRNRMP